MSAYGLFIAGVGIVLLLSYFHPKTSVFWKRHKQNIAMVLLWVSLPWLALDIFSAGRGWWSYNSMYVYPIRFVNLPIEEVMFFIGVPLVSLFLWWLLNNMHICNPKRLSNRVNHIMLVMCVIFCVVVLLLGLGKERTMLDAGLFLIMLYGVWRSGLVMLARFWIWSGVMLGLFVISNVYLTALPIVIYNTDYMSGFRFITIPIEDFLYNFALLWHSLLVFKFSAQRQANLFADD